MESPRTEEPPDFLVRSREEVIRVLNGVMAQGAVLSISFLNIDRVAVSSLVDVDEPGNRLLLACPPDWRSTLDSSGGDSIMVACVCDDAKIQFQAGGGDVVDLDGLPLVSLNIPDFMWRFQRRRAQRHSVSALKITLNLGFLDCEAEVTNLALGGIGMVDCDSEVKLEAGEVLRDCTIALPGVGQIVVDLTVQHQLPMQMTDGRPGTRVGCQFTRLGDSTQQLITHYLDALAHS